MAEVHVLSFLATVANTFATPENTENTDSVEVDYSSARQFRAGKVIAEDYLARSEALGEGCQGTVLVAERKYDGERFALKKLQRRGADGSLKKRVASEAAILASMDHPHIVRLVDLYDSGESLDLVMECLEGGELYERLLACGPFSEAKAASAVRQMLLALNHLHHQGVAHRDVKLENFIYANKSSDVLKLVDFGHAASLAGDLATERLGTEGYMAPEVLSGSHGTACDMWSLGVVVYALVGGCMPFEASSPKGKRRMQKGKFEFAGAWAETSELAKDFVRRLLQPDQSSRMTASDALNHPWIKECTCDKTDKSAITRQQLSCLRSWTLASALTRACCLTKALTAHSLGNDARRVFLRLSPSGTGDISEVSASLSQCGMSANEVHQLAATLDADASGRMSLSALAAALAGCEGLEKEEVQSVFQRWDREAQGCVTATDVAVAVGIPEQSAAVLLAESGQAEALTLEELTEALAPRPRNSMLCSRRRTASAKSWSSWGLLRFSPVSAFS